MVWDGDAMIYLLFISIAALLTTFLISRAYSELFQINIFGGWIFLFFITAAIYFAGKLYCIEWGKIDGHNRKFWVHLYEKFLLPFALLFFLFGKVPLEYITDRQGLLFSSFILFILLTDWTGHIKNRISNIYPGVSELEAKRLFFHYPPLSRIDMLPFDLLFNGALVFMIYRRAFYIL